jgi:hypothetical protein
MFVDNQNVGGGFVIDVAAARINAEAIAQAASLLGLPAGKTSAREYGCVIVFRAGHRCGDVECFDDGEAVAVTYDQNGMPRTWDVDMDPEGIQATLRQIQRYISTDSIA